MWAEPRWLALSFYGLPRLSPNALAMAVCALFLIPLLPLLGIREPARTRSPAGFLTQISGVLKELWEFVKFRRTWAGLLFLLSPAGNAGTQFAALTTDFHVSVNEVALVTGLGAGFSAGGSLIGGWVADRVGRPVSYVICGLLFAVCGRSVAAGLLSPAVFAVGALAYALTTGFSNAVTTAMVLETVGGRQRLAATGYSVLTSAANLPVSYMAWLCSSAYKRNGAHGSVAFDALANAAAAVFLTLFLVWCRRRKGDWDLAPAPPVARGPKETP
jgi:MFS family permease